MTTHVHSGHSVIRRSGVAGWTRVYGPGRESKAPPLLRDGQVRCPVCRNGVTPTDRGYLRRHRDLFGHDCHNRAT